MGKNVRKTLVLILILVGIIINSIQVFAADDFNLNGPGDLDFGCTNKYDNLLYVAGNIKRIDPVFLKTIMCQESSGNRVIAANRDRQGNVLSYDAGIMQINDVSSFGYSVSDRNNNDILNVWLSIKVINQKIADVRRLDGTSSLVEEIQQDSFSVLWLYNGHSRDNMESYAVKVNDIYMANTKLTAETRGLTFDRNYRVIPLRAMKPIMKNTGSLVGIDNSLKFAMDEESYSDFLSEVDSRYKLLTGTYFSDEPFYDKSIPKQDSSRSYIQNKYKVDSWTSGGGRTYSDLVTENRYSTDVTGNNEHNQKLEYNSYKFTKAVIKGIFYIIAIFIFWITILLVMTWVTYVFYLLGVYRANNVMRRITRGKLNCNDEDIIKDLIFVSIMVVVALSLVISGALQAIISHVVLWLMTVTIGF